MSTCRKQGIVERFLPVRLQERGWKPCRLIAMQDLSCFFPIGPPNTLAPGALGQSSESHHIVRLIRSCILVRRLLPS
jgi:hypothetical protein